MVAFAMIVSDELGERPTEMPLAERNHAVQAFLFNGANKPLRVRFAVGRTERRPDDAHTGLFKQVPNRGAPLAIPVTN